MCMQISLSENGFISKLHFYSKFIILDVLDSIKFNYLIAQSVFSHSMLVYNVGKKS